MRKFTIDLEEKKILFHEPFSKEDLEEVLSLLNIPDTETWKIDLADNYLSDRQPTDIWQTPNIITYPAPNWGGDYTDPYQPPFIITSSGTGTGNIGTITYGSTTTGEITFNNTTDTFNINTLDSIYNENN